MGRTSRNGSLTFRNGKLSPIKLVDLLVAVNSHLTAALLSEAPATYRESFSAAARAGAISEELGARLAPSAGVRQRWRARAGHRSATMRRHDGDHCRVQMTPEIAVGHHIWA